MSNRALAADAAETAFCAFTSAAALLGLAPNARAGWWWADPAAALVIGALAIREGIECLAGCPEPGGRRSPPWHRATPAGESVVQRDAGSRVGPDVVLRLTAGQDRRDVALVDQVVGSLRVRGPSAVSWDRATAEAGP